MMAVLNANYIPRPACAHLMSQPFGDKPLHARGPVRR